MSSVLPISNLTLCQSCIESCFAGIFRLIFCICRPIFACIASLFGSINNGPSPREPILENINAPTSNAEARLVEQRQQRESLLSLPNSRASNAEARLVQQSERQEGLQNLQVAINELGEAANNVSNEIALLAEQNRTDARLIEEITQNLNRIPPRRSVCDILRSAYEVCSTYFCRH